MLSMGPENSMVAGASAHDGQDESKSNFFTDLIALLSNPQFQYIRQKYMTTWTDVETLFLYIFVAELITI